MRPREDDRDERKQRGRACDVAPPHARMQGQRIVGLHVLPRRLRCATRPRAAIAPWWPVS
ncbi:MAG: hypothetical protein AVDCRST_MAG67-379 [uncultured Solirubrobacteraceae bacterium]|uniref:Uncharacterized protein n=1 Tax=uncultured Solirubrobacteraceae bacterium TaxID=1162706 RepID=A0A6J4RRJ4_9ACTN|nr:MAG: hypothetical protein AVDCRST_MAG67-379 [uncultured Solirubrobacteraceae bacterium]